MSATNNGRSKRQVAAIPIEIDMSHASQNETPNFWSTASTFDFGKRVGFEREEGWLLVGMDYHWWCCYQDVDQLRNRARWNE